MVTAFEQWPRAKAWQWYNAQAWPCGFNYVPASAISYTEMWMDYCFDPALIDKELALAQTIGFNCIRVVLSFVVWENDQEAFIKRFEEFLGICDRRGLRVMPCLFDDCVFGPIVDPVFSKQPEIIEGWYANGWTPSPGRSMVRDPQTWPRLEKYVKEIVGTFKDDRRLWVWDLYNEPTYNNLDASIALLENVIRWAREINPSQPLTAGQWNGNSRLNDLIYSFSDIITFHDYNPPEGLKDHLLAIKAEGRPLICTEWLNRVQGSTVADCLPILRHEGVGAIHWGLVNGRTQTHLNWGHRPGDVNPVAWQHDIIRPDYTPYDTNEIKLFQAMIPQDLGNNVSK